VHFPLNEDNSKLNELIRVGNKVAQKLGYNYFWVSASCLDLDDAELALSLDEQAVIEERDVSVVQEVP
jgi:hypothetical protein